MAESLEKRIDRLCKLVGRTPDELQRSGEWVLGLAGDVCRDTSLYADDTVEDLCSDSFESDEYRKMSEGLVRLEFFASEMTRQKYHAEISEIMSTAWMLKVLEVLKANIYSFRKYGPQFVSILSLAYMNSFNYTVEEMAEDYLNKHKDLNKAAKSMLNHQVAKCTTSGVITGFGGEPKIPIGTRA